MSFTSATLGVKTVTVESDLTYNHITMTKKLFIVYLRK